MNRDPSFECKHSRDYIREYVVAYCNNNNMTCVCSTTPAFTITYKTLQMDIYLYNNVMEFKRRVGDVFTALHILMDLKRALSNEPVEQSEQLEQPKPITTELYDFDTLQTMQ